MQTGIISSQRPIRSLVIAFAAWKTLLLLIAICSPGPGYDTSTTLNISSHGLEAKQLPSLLNHLIIKLTRWDAIYLVKAANRGHIFEQEWAWWGFSKLISLTSAGN